ncbi:MAG TPA: hypothetical protein VIK73_03800 [Limnochordales bacterium]
MARIRTIKPEFFDDYEFINGLSRDERLYYIGLWVRACDDRGVFIDSPHWLKKEIFPYDDDITPETIEGWNRSLEAKGRIIRYELNGKRYAVVVRFLDHQRVNRPSAKSCHPIPDAWRFDEDSWRWIEGPSPLQESPGSTHDTINEPSLSAHPMEVEEEMEMEHEHEGESEPASPTGDAPPLIRPERVVELWNEICGDVLPSVRSLTDTRRKKIRSRIMAEPGRDETWWRTYFSRIRASPFCCGENSRGWQATLDFAIRSEDVVAKVLEGVYDGRRQGGRRIVPGSAGSANNRDLSFLERQGA